MRVSYTFAGHNDTFVVITSPGVPRPKFNVWVVHDDSGHYLKHQELYCSENSWESAEKRFICQNLALLRDSLNHKASFDGLTVEEATNYTVLSAHLDNMIVDIFNGTPDETLT